MQSQLIFDVKQVYISYLAKPQIPQKPRTRRYEMKQLKKSVTHTVCICVTKNAFDKNLASVFLSILRLFCSLFQKFGHFKDIILCLFQNVNERLVCYLSNKTDFFKMVRKDRIRIRVHNSNFLVNFYLSSKSTERTPYS